MFAAALFLIQAAIPQPEAPPPTPVPAVDSAPVTDSTTAQTVPTDRPRGPVVVVATSLGRIVLGLDREKAPLTVANFLKYVRAGHYDHTVFHRVIPRFMIQGGGYEEDMSEHPVRPPVQNESQNGLSNKRGSVAMARTAAPNSATAQFFINLKDNQRLDGRPGRPGYTVFGEVLEGLDVVDRIAAVPTKSFGRYQNVPSKPVTIQSVREAPGWKPKAAAPPAPAGETPSAVREPAAASPAP